jgi:hypothetical protein
MTRSISIDDISPLHQSTLTVSFVSMTWALCIDRCHCQVFRLCIFAQLVALHGILVATVFIPTFSIACRGAAAVVFLRAKNLAHAQHAFSNS